MLENQTMIKNKTWAELTQAEVDAEAKLTAKESRAVSSLVRAVRRLPSGFCLSVDDEGFSVQKRITKGFAMGVAAVKRKTLHF
jgi:hypothetical protein